MLDTRTEFINSTSGTILARASQDFATRVQNEMKCVGSGSRVRVSW